MDKYENEFVKEEIIKFLGNEFIVKTNYEKNELIFKTSKTEKLIVMIILLLIFIIAAFNLVASLTMLFIEKMDNIKTMSSFGADRKFVFKIFFFEGLMISLKGIIIGLILGYAICFTQIYGELLQMPNSVGRMDASIRGSNPHIFQTTRVRHFEGVSERICRIIIEHEYIINHTIIINIEIIR